MTMTERLLHHNLWATRVLLDRCRLLTAEQFMQRHDIGPGSLHDTLRHIVGAMFRWADRLAGRTVRDSIERNPRPQTPDELLTLLDRAARELEEVVTRIDRESRHDEKMRTEFPGEPFTRGTAVVHVVTHGVHHRAQALNMLRRLGVADLPELDAISWERQTT
ncbi:MAG: DinB family protein [Armatimonadota bacterium]|nr:DinB family protein [Armatimonadota bacterium]